MSKEGHIRTLRRAKKVAVKLVLWILTYIASAAIAFIYIPQLIPTLAVFIQDYMAYIAIALTLVFGYAIVQSIAELAYWILRVKHPHPTAAAARSLIKMLGIGGLLAAAAGGAVGGAGAVALGGFIGMVIGFATQQTLSQALSGLFLLLIRPIKIGDKVTVAGETGIVEDISTMFTIVRREDGTRALIPNNSILGGKIYIHPTKT